jgi:uncharacterized protein YbjT (DUF2867 family)
VPLFANVQNEATVHRAVDGADAVINLVGILAEGSGATFQGVHAEAGERIARLATASGVMQLVQMSAIGADAGSASRYGSSKAAAEAAVRTHYQAASILRPSIVFGTEDKFFNRFAEMTRLLPFMPVISGRTKLQPVFVGDVADAVMACLNRDDARGRTFELGGPRVWTFRELLEFIVQQTRRHRRLIEVPMGMARIQANIMQHLPGKPLTPDQLLMLQYDNVVSPGSAGLTELGITPTPVELVVPSYLSRFQPGGGKRPVSPLPQEG